MKAFLLAAGKGERLRPITNDIPKCLVPIGRRELIEYWFDLFIKHGIRDVLINTHYLAQKVEDYIGRHQVTGLNIITTFEEELLGSGGTIKKNKAFVQNEESFLICYADNFTNADLTKIISAHNAHDKMLTLGVFHAEIPQECGVVTIDNKGVVTGFEEKPNHPQSDLAAAGIYVSRKGLFDHFPKGDIFDLGKDVFPRMAGHMMAQIINEQLIDVGTIDNFNKVNTELIKEGQVWSL